MKRIVVIGGTGHFGARLCRRLAGEANTELVVASRSQAGSQSLVEELRRGHPAATIDAARLDQFTAGFAKDLESLRPDIVVHTVGPYQGQDYRVARCCIEVGSHYVDLADGRDFVCGFAALDPDAKRRGVLLVAGASTLPGLSGAVVDSLRNRFDSIDEIELSIAPAHRTPRGTGTIAAVLSYCGRPFEVLVDGRWVTMHGWQSLRRYQYPSLGSRLAAACDVPDLGLLPNYLPGVRTVTFRAALEAQWEQAALWIMAWMVRARMVRSWRPLVPRFRWLSERLAGLGSDRGGMHVRLRGKTADGSSKTVTWQLTARSNHGPEIPCTPALILVRKLAADTIDVRGARACMGLFTMAEFDDELRNFDIDWTVEEAPGR
jgi:saccharopine dehydrogenase-like NADP-dependent oxidoreductase